MATAGLDPSGARHGYGLLRGDRQAAWQLNCARQTSPMEPMSEGSESACGEANGVKDAPDEGGMRGEASSDVPTDSKGSDDQVPVAEPLRRGKEDRQPGSRQEAEQAEMVFLNAWIFLPHGDESGRVVGLSPTS